MNNVTPVANLLALRMDELMPALLGKSATAKGGTVGLKLSKEQAYTTRSVFAYYQLVDAHSMLVNMRTAIEGTELITQ